MSWISEVLDRITDLFCCCPATAPNGGQLRRYAPVEKLWLLLLLLLSPVATSCCWLSRLVVAGKMVSSGERRSIQLGGGGNNKLLGSNLMGEELLLW